MTRLHQLGIWMMILCTALILLPSPHKAHSTITIYDEEVEVCSPMVPVLFAIFTSMLFCARTLLLKHYAVNLDCDPMLFTSLSYIASGSLLTIVCVIVMLNTNWTYHILMINIISGILSCLGNILINHATSHGVAGAAAGLTNIQPVLQTLLNAFIFYQFPSITQIVGLFIGVLGSIALSI